MPTFITTAPIYYGITGSAEKRADTAPDGTLWMLVAQPGAGKMFSSSDGGATWTYASTSDLLLNSPKASFPSLFIDADGFAHAAWPILDSNPQQLRYARGVPRAGGGWAWTYLTITPAGGIMAWHVDVVAFRVGTGWIAWVGYDYFGANTSQDGNPHVARVDIASNGRLTLGSANTGPPAVAGDGQHPRLALEFAHDGKGKVPSATPHLFCVSGNRNAPAAMKGRRAAYSGGTWTWETPVSLDASVRIDALAMTTVWDGSRLCVVYSPTSTQVKMLEWDGTPGGAVTQRNPPAPPAGIGNIVGVSVEHDPVTHDLYVTAVDDLDGDVRLTVLTRASNTWSAWTILESRGQSYGNYGRLQMVRHAQRDTINLVWGEGGPIPGYTGGLKVFHTQVATLTRTPPAPSLDSPASGARVDLATNGATFSWTYQGTGPNDRQTAWALRRSVSGVYGYWNAGSQAWSAVLVWNTGAAQSASFPAGAWANGATYPWTVATKNNTGQVSPWAAERSVTATAAPVLAVTAPAGLVFTDSTPTVVWSYIGSDPQRSYEVRIVAESTTIDSANPGPALWTSGLVSSATARQITVDTPLANGGTYRAYVQVVSSTGLSSAWTYSQFSLSLQPPSGPLVQVVPEWSYPGEVPRARLKVQARSNFMSATQAQGTTEWEADYNATVAAVAFGAVPNIDAGYSITATAAGAAGARTVPGSPPPAQYGQPQPTGPLSFPAVDGDSYTALASVETPAAIRAARVSIRWYSADDGTGTLVSTSQGDQVNTTTSGYTQVSVSASAPVGARLGRVLVEVLGMAAGEVAYVSRASFHPGLVKVWQPGGFSLTQVVRVERSDDEGTTWTPVLDSQRVGVDTWQRAVTRDRLVPFSILSWWRAYTDVVTDDGVLTSDPSTPAKAVVASDDAWAIRDTTDPDGEVLAYVTDHKRGDADQATATNVAGRLFPIVDTEGVQGATGTLTIYVPSDWREATVDLLTRGRALYVQSPMGAVMCVYFLSRDYTALMAGARTIDADYVQVG